jgi:hypothetical protein
MPRVGLGSTWSSICGLARPLSAWTDRRARMGEAVTFAVHCPHCRHGNEDPFEVMALGDLDWTRCASCGRKFFYLIADCQACEGESVFTWAAPPEPPWTALLRCSHCGDRLTLCNEAYRAD